MSTEGAGADPETARGGATRGGAIKELAEDATGFGVTELRTTKDLLLRPRKVLDAYEAHGATGGGLYTRAFRYYLALNGVYLLLIALTGGFERMFQAMPPEVLEWATRQSGKSADAFRADLDQWMSLIALPVTALTFAIPLYWLFRRWSGADARTGFRQTFTYLSLYTLYGAPISLLSALVPGILPWLSAMTFLLTPLVFLVLGGGGRWWRTKRGAAGRALLLVLCVNLASLPGGVLIWGIGLAGAIYGP